MGEIFISKGFYIGYSIFLVLLFIGLACFIFIPYYHAKKNSELAVDKLKDVGGHSPLNRRIMEFHSWVEENAALPFIKECMKPAWDYFKQKYQQSEAKHYDFAPDVYDFFLEDQFIQKYGNRKLAEVIPGIFLALGIFGTFLSIAVGISKLSVNGDATAMQNGIEVLLHGMEGKFISSLVGISLSIIWQGLDRGAGYPFLAKSFQQLRQQLDYTFPTKDESSVLLQLLKNEETRVNEYRELIKNDIVPELSKTISEGLQTALVPAIEKMKIDILELQKNGVSEMVHYFIDSLNSMAGSHMNELVETVNKTMEWQERVRKEVDLLVKAIQESSETQMKITEKNNLISMDIVSYADRLEEMVSQFSDVTGKMNIYQAEVANLLDKLTLERDLFHEFYSKHMGNLQDDIDKINSLTKHQVEYQSKLEGNLQMMQDLSHLQVDLASSLTDQAKNAQSMTDELNKTLTMIEHHGSTFIRLQSAMKDEYDKLSVDRKQQDEQYQQILTNVSIQSANIDDQVKALRDIWDSASNTLSTSINHFIRDMNQGLSDAFKRMDSELARSVDYLTESTNAIQNGVSELPNIIGDLKQSLDEVNKRAVG
ncbi:hypothetical protein [Neobacillus sp. SAB-20_R2A]|uniref:hypothetical protein n=1 Tax=Neobacillus sp. SAB-20_R2A TaxID=3120519 RepID=UPI003C6E231B